jgi:DNA-binding XRE family transcriptional regulator
MKLEDFRAWRRKHMVTQREMAAMIGIGLKHLEALEIGTRPLTVRTGKKLTAFMARWKGR